ncbi:MAG: nicotinamide mononucleotide transporter [Oscillospiraceae bacterium]|nr:nicotinamide mononucleotide transporter [Oscillospiraceae bacterium]
MLHNPFKGLKKREWCLWIISLIVVAVSNILAGKTDPVTISATLIGVTALIFVARGDVWGQILTVVFSVLYAITSYSFHYYGEMITYVGMTAPIAVFSIVTWLKNPSAEEKNTVKISKLTRRNAAVMTLLCIAVTAVFGYILAILDTPNLVVSIISIVTSFLASYLMLFRNPYYALAYAANDVVLIILWVLASLDNIAYLPMIACFLMFLANDIYGFISWKKRELKQAVVQSADKLT